MAAFLSLEPLAPELIQGCAEVDVELALVAETLLMAETQKELVISQGLEEAEVVRLQEVVLR